MSYRWKTAFVLGLAALAATSSGPALAETLQTGARVRAETLQPDADEDVQYAASVVELTALNHQGDATAKLFGTAGGDPAMNGLYTYLAFYESPADGWRVFRLGDFLSYRVLSDARGRVSIEVRESIMNEATSEISARTRRFNVTWTPGPDNVPPATVTVTPAP